MLHIRLVEQTWRVARHRLGAIVYRSTVRLLCSDAKELLLFHFDRAIIWTAAGIEYIESIV